MNVFYLPEDKLPENPPESNSPSELEEKDISHLEFPIGDESLPLTSEEVRAFAHQRPVDFISFALEIAERHTDGEGIDSKVFMEHAIYHGRNGVNLLRLINQDGDGSYATENHGYECVFGEGDVKLVDRYISRAGLIPIPEIDD